MKTPRCQQRICRYTGMKEAEEGTEEDYDEIQKPWRFRKFNRLTFLRSRRLENLAIGLLKQPGSDLSLEVWISIGCAVTTDSGVL